MAATEPIMPVPRRLSIRLPLPLWIGLATVMVVVASCQRDSTSPSLSARPQAEKAPEQTIKVLVTANGEIVADGHPVTLDQLSVRLTELEQAGGQVWYYRENPSDEPHMNAMKVIDLVAQNRLPIRLSSKPDFSAFVDAKDIPRSRFYGPASPAR
jgi:biopolymer transport protein ExbD